jgi:hypothetical protein
MNCRQQLTPTPQPTSPPDPPAAGAELGSALFLFNRDENEVFATISDCSTVSRTLQGVDTTFIYLGGSL